MREYRLMRKNKGNLYYPQVRESKYLISIFLYHTEWKRIVAYSDVFELKCFDNYSCGETWAESKKIIMDYEDQFMSEEPPSVFAHISQTTVRYDIEMRNNLKPKYQIPNLELNKQTSKQ